jgi:hypothetical protein
MKTKYLFPYWCKYLGAICFVAHVPVMLFVKLKKETLASNFSGAAEDYQGRRIKITFIGVIK